MSKGKYNNPFSATFNGIAQIFQKQERIGKLSESDRLEGKTCMVTGANSGLGYAIAVQMAERGAHVIMACRSGIPEAGERVKMESGSDKVEMMKVDLSSFETIDRLVEGLVHPLNPPPAGETGAPEIDILVCNAAIVPKQSRKTVNGFDEMFQVNYLSKFYLVNKLLQAGVIRNSEFAGNYDQNKGPSRIIFVSSESHRSGQDIDFDRLGVYEEYTIGKTISLYGYFKLLMTTFANELSRRLNKNDKIEVAVHALCPGPVNSNIAKEAPGIFKPLIGLIFKIFFRDPKTAAEPVMYFACSEEMGENTTRYLHLMAEKEMDERSKDPASGKKLWEKSEALVGSREKAVTV
ncbi:MAG: SDR family NAD(P)-dependent oxidoreductase [Chitinophagales bacterium]|nr:SDR family NAD(P)-dependent oxidoreductase [Chitinophagales bacterium]